MLLLVALALLVGMFAGAAIGMYLAGYVLTAAALAMLTFVLLALLNASVLINGTRSTRRSLPVPIGGGLYCSEMRPAPDLDDPAVGIVQRKRHVQQYLAAWRLADARRR